MKQSKPGLLSQIINTIFSLLLTIIRPLLGPAICRYSVGCTAYAQQQLKEKSTLPALVAITKRVLSCNPFTK